MTQEENIGNRPQAIPPALRNSAAPSVANQPQTQATPQNIPTQHTTSSVDYAITGTSSQFLELKLRPGQSIVGEVTALMYFESGINMKMRASGSMGSGNIGFFAKLLGLGKAALKGEKLFMMSFTNASQKELKIAFSMPYIGSVVPIELRSTGGLLFCQNDSFLCASSDLKITPVSTGELGSNFMNVITSMQKIEGDGTLFLFCGGTLLQRKIALGEALNVTSGAALAMQPTVIFKNKTIRNVGVTGEGHMLTEISGTGNVWLQSAPFKRFNDNIISNISAFFGLKKKKTNPVWGKK